MDFDWSDMRQFDGPDNKKSDSSNNKKNNTGASSESKEEKEKVVIDLTADNKGGKEIELNDWSDIRRFDGDHDDDWFSCEERKLAEQYGGNFIKVRYADHGRVVYFCELCLAECNAKKSLELHCGGMKHLKKKDLWEKEKRHPGSSGLTTEVGPKPSKESKKEKFSKDRRGRSPPPPPPQRRRYDRSRSPARRPSWGRERRGGHSPPFLRDSFDDSRDRFSSPPRKMRPKYGGHGGRDRFDSPIRRRTPSPRTPSPDRYGRGFGNRRSRFSDSLDNTPCPPSPPRFRSSKFFDNEQSSLSSSPVSGLLQKLSQCCVKSVDDADLALNVVASLAQSLKEYSQRNGENKIAELLMEAELKIGTVKALKVGMKMLSNFADSAQSGPKSDNLSEMSFFDRKEPDRGLGGPNMGGRMGPPFQGPMNTEMGSLFRPPAGPPGFMNNERPMPFNPPPPGRMPWM